VQNDIKTEVRNGSEQRTQQQMNGNCFDITLTDVAAYDWEATLFGVERPVCWSYAAEFFRRSAQYAQAGDARGERVFRFLGAVTSLALQLDDTESPFTPSIVMNNRRSSALEDFTDVEFDVMAGLLPTTQDAAMRARFADILLVARKDCRAAKVAAEAYLENFKRIDTAKNWAWDIKSFRRGFGLARLLGKKNEPFPSYVAHVEGLIATIAGSHQTDALCAELMDLLLEHEVGDYLMHAATAEQVANTIEASGNFFLAQRYLEIATRLYRAGKNEEAAQQARRIKGESLVRQAQAVSTRPGQGYSTGSHFFAMGIECLRQAQAPGERIDGLHKLLREWQEASLHEIQTYTHEADISILVESARDYIRGKPLGDAVLAFALRHPPVKLSELRKRVIENADEFPLSHLMGATFMSHDGRVLAYKPPVIKLGKDADEIAIEAEMISQARNVDWPLRVGAYIEPCRLQILQEHRPSLRDLAFLVEHNPFIPPGHEALFLRGIHAGFHGDMVICAHVLIPQVEEAIRHVLRQTGIVTSKLDSKLVQEERLLGVLLAMPETIQIFGEDCVFELRGVLCEKFGFDLRNRLAHGFMTTQECFGPDVLLAWWLVLRLSAFPIYRELKQESSTSEQDGVENKGT
jgi:hypothetical protein